MFRAGQRELELVCGFIRFRAGLVGLAADRLSCTPFWIQTNLIFEHGLVWSGLVSKMHKYTP